MMQLQKLDFNQYLHRAVIQSQIQYQLKIENVYASILLQNYVHESIGWIGRQKEHII